MRYTTLFGLVALWLFSPAILQAKTVPSELLILPSQITLTGPKATQRLLVVSQQDGRCTGDLTTKATFVSSNPKVAVVSKDGIVRAVGDGMAKITASLSGQMATVEVRVEKSRTPFVWSFRNHVLPVLSKAGCNGGACHGAAAGKGGLKLTLRGYDPIADHKVLTRQAMGRRVVPGHPEESLMILKPTLALGHGGGERIKKKSADYLLLTEWIRSGAPGPKSDDPILQKLEVFPNIATLEPGDTQQILVRAWYTDGHCEDVTRWVKFGTSDSSVATVTEDGMVKVEGNGEAAITVWFSSKVTFARVVSPFSASAPLPELRKGQAAASYIDKLIYKKLASLGIPPSPPSDDYTFIRRAYLDAAGILPTRAEVEAFVQDTSPNKRAKLIESLLSRPEFVDYWTYKWSDLFLVSSRKLSGRAMTAFYQWLRQSVAENKPWNQLARDMITATGSNLDNPAANYYVIHKEATDLTETTTQAFLGMSLMCARCHNHPLEKWTQHDYYQMANLFARIRLKRGDRDGEVLVLASDTGEVNHPRLGIPLPPRPLDGQEIPLEDTRDRRQFLADWLTSPENPYFAKAIINRVWRNFMGRGLVEAEDDLRLTNPPSNQELLDALAEDFVRNGYDIKRLIRLIMNSEAYQRSAAPTGINAKDDRYFSRYLPRRLPAEVLLDAMSQVTGVPTEFGGYPKGTRAMQLRDTTIASYFLSAFGRPERVQTCSCERQQETNVTQALHLANGDTLNNKLRAKGGVIDQLVADEVEDEEILKELFLSALSREPTQSEREKLLPVLAATTPDPLGDPSAQVEARRAAIEDLFWAVLTDREFLFNH